MITSKDAMDNLASDPHLSLSFDERGKAQWWKRAARTRLPIQAKRSKCIVEGSGMTSDEMLITILKLNPGMELQLDQYHGTFPYMALLAHSANQIQVPEGVFISDGAICCTQEIYHGTAMLAKIYK